MALFVSSFDSFLPHFADRLVLSDMSFSSEPAATIVAAAVNLSNVRMDAYNDNNVEQRFCSHQTAFEIGRVIKQIENTRLLVTLCQGQSLTFIHTNWKHDAVGKIPTENCELFLFRISVGASGQLTSTFCASPPKRKISNLPQ